MKSVPISFLVWCGLPPCRFRPLCVVLFVPPSHLCTVWRESGYCWGLWSSQTGSETPGNMDQLAAQSGITSPDLPVLVPLSPLHKLPVSSSLLIATVHTVHEIPQRIHEQVITVSLHAAIFNMALVSTPALSLNTCMQVCLMNIIFWLGSWIGWCQEYRDIVLDKTVSSSLK